MNAPTGILCLLLLSSVSGMAAIRNASSPALADVQSAVNAASHGDTVIIPAGTAEWKAPLEVLKAITLQGAGAGKTIILDSVPASGGWNSKCTVYVRLVQNRMTRVTGIEFRDGPASKSGTPDGGIIYVNDPSSNNGSQRCRIDHCRFENVDQASGIIRIDGAFGVTDNCEFIRTGSQFSHVIGHSGYNAHIYPGASKGDGSWTDGPNWGSGKFWFVEDCTSTKSGTIREIIDSDRGARWVYRYNYDVNARLTMHGTDSGNRQRGTRAVEVYNNTVIGDGSNSTFLRVRSGAALCYNNTVEYMGSTACIIFSTFRMADDNNGGFYPWGGADGTNPWDLNDPAGVFAKGTASGGGARTMTDTSKKWTVNQWRGYTIRKTSPTASKMPHFAMILGNTANTITYSASTYENDLTFAAGESYEIRRVLQALDMCGAGAGDYIDSDSEAPRWLNQRIDGAYQWNNNVNGGVNNARFAASWPGFQVEGVHYFNAPYAYTPYPYPHPARNAENVASDSRPAVEINQAQGQSDPTSSTSILFAVTFDQAVTGFGAGDVILGGTAGATTAVIREVWPNNGTTYSVEVSGMSREGSVVVEVGEGVAWNSSGEPNRASTSVDNYVSFAKPDTATTPRTLYVDQKHSSASDSNPGTQNAPWKTIVHAASVARAGDTVLVKPGVYGGNIVPANAGTESQPIRFVVEPADRGNVVISNNGYTNGKGFYVNGTDHIVINGFVIQTVNQGVYVNGSDYVAILNCIVRDIGQEGIRYRLSNHGLIENNAVYGTGRRYLQEGEPWNGEGIYLGSAPGDVKDNSSHLIVRGNTVYDNTNEGIELKPGTHHCTIEGNVVRDSVIADGGGINLHASGSWWPEDPEHIVRNNLVYNISTRTQWLDGNGIRVGTGAYVYNNIVHGNQHFGIRVDDKEANRWLARIYHNTIAPDNRQGSLMVYNSARTDVKNNIGPVASGNLAFSTGYFVDAARHDFRLMPNSAPVDAGANVGVVTDYDGAPRPAGDQMDMGAYEYRGLVPSAPTGLRVVSQQGAN